MGFGDFFLELRKRQNLSLREFCQKNGFDASNISKLERGILPPPQNEVLEKYAKALELVVGTDDWYQFHDLAAAENRKLPAYMSEEEIEKKVPIFFRALRDNAEDIDIFTEKLKEKIKASWRA
ncbi:transcriptional regulator HipB [Candidatus Termititenax persephonae]|uniref:Transcriptional regulator HipB n=1 Tax=Candidatus Termititenax persephonae TaxID=2218525 RepID=A0A388TIK4_9BACT|nr:transcriptional regulator HipB [Candidatus Termititenax persephonae]